MPALNEGTHSIDKPDPGGKKLRLKDKLWSHPKQI